MGLDKDLRAYKLMQGIFEDQMDCNICIMKIKCTDGVWNCSRCDHMFHMNCMNKWIENCN